MMEAETSSIASTARRKMHNIWSQIRAMTSVEEEPWKNPNRTCSNKSFEEETECGGEENGTFEVMMKTIFGSCTTGNYRQATPPDLAPTRSRSSSCQSPTPPGKHYCGDDRVRAEQAVTALREQKEISKRMAKLQSPLQSTALTKPFPASSPKRSPAHEIPGPMEHKGTFDDGISAISAYTLEEMARMEELHNPANLLPVRSDLTQETFDNPFECQQSQPHHDEVVAAVASELNRRRSHGSNNSKVTKGTRSTRSSNNSKSTFESNWRKNEQKYWEQQVAEEERHAQLSRATSSSSRQLESVKKAQERRASSRSRSVKSRESNGDFSKKVDATITTASSSAYSGFESPFNARHPHDTFHIDGFLPSPATIVANKRVQSTMIAHDDPDRIILDQEIMLIAHDSEFAEI